MKTIFAIILSLALTPANAAVTVVVNGSNHTIPQTNEKGWGANVTAWIQAISQYTLQPNGGTFTLTADTDFGATYGLKSAYFKSRTANISSAGVLRLANTDTIGWRNNANSGNVLLSVDTSDRLLFNSVLLPALTASDFTDSGFNIVDNGDVSKKIAFQASGITSSTTRTITMPDADVNLGLLAPKASPTFSGTITTPLTASRLLVTGASNELAVSAVTATEAGYLAGVSSAIQTQLGLKAPLASPTFTGTVTTPVTASRALVTGASSELAVSATTATELGYVNGVTSAIQTQLASVHTTSNDSNKIANCSITSSIASSALTIALKDAGGSDASAGSPCEIAFRSATAATGTSTVVSTTGALSIVVSNGSALGCTVSAACTLYVYAINNAGTVVLGVINGPILDEGTVYTSTALAGSGGDDLASVLYTTATQSTKAIRLIGRVTVAPAAAFAWTNAPTENSVFPFTFKPWYVDVNIAGANPSLGISAVTAYAEITDAGLTMTPRTGSAPAGVMCDTTNAATAPTTSTSTCSAGSESLGVNFLVPEPGVYEVCADFAWSTQVDTADLISVAFELIETPLSAQTLTLEGGSRINTSVNLIATGGVNSNMSYPEHICGIFNWTSVTPGTAKGVRLMFEQLVATPDTSIILADADANQGQRDIHITARRWTR